MPIKYHPDMNKALLFFAFLLFSLKGFSQQGGGDASAAISYGGHSFGTAYDEDAKLALWSQRLINNQRSIDTFANQRYDKYVTDYQYNNSVRELEKTVRNKHRVTDASPEIKNWLNEYYTLQNAISGVVMTNPADRHFMYVLNNRVMMTINEGMTMIEGWDLDQTLFNLQNAVREASAYVRMNAIDNDALRAAWATVSNNPHFYNCKYMITVDDSLFAKAGSPSNIDIYIVDQLHYNIAKTRYKTDISKGAIPDNFRNRQKESNFLKDYLKATMTITNEPLMYNISLGDHIGEKPNTCLMSLSLIPDWYIYVFYKGRLYYVNSLPKGGMNEMVNVFIPNKM